MKSREDELNILKQEKEVLNQLKQEKERLDQRLNEANLELEELESQEFETKIRLIVLEELLKKY